ncbi:MAG: tetratricopeptide repeat protein [Phycisphaerae bacterium]|jgi:tetratricopeptide (TPR) repeat protein|nr:tetratricopeptide repeat protein [Phycisphaerae bacterium]
MIEKTKQLRGLTLAAGCVAIVLSALLCGCESKEDRKKRAEAYWHEAWRAYNQGDWADAIPAWKKYVDLEPDYDYSLAYYMMGCTYLRLDQHAEAIAAWKKYIDVNPDSSRAYYRMGHSHEVLKQYPEARAALKKAKEAIHKRIIAIKTYNLRTSSKLRTYLSQMFDPIGGMYKSRENAQGQRQSGSSYFGVAIDSRSDAEKWWEKNRHKSPEEIRQMIRDWYVEREVSFGFKDAKQKEHILRRIEQDFSSRSY